MGRVNSKVAIITGTAGEQRSAEAMILAKEEVKVVATDLNGEGVKTVTDEVIINTVNRFKT